ncbi:MAG: hypothetical protein ACXWU5_03350, partial [Rhodoplanes sp.]
SGISGDHDCISLGSHPSTSAASPRIRTAFLESQPIQPIQQVLGRTLKEGDVVSISISGIGTLTNPFA